jgi:hypothetical protein
MASGHITLRRTLLSPLSTNFIREFTYLIFKLHYSAAKPRATALRYSNRHEALRAIMLSDFFRCFTTFDDFL